MLYSELKENTKHGSDSFPIEYYSVTKNHPRYIMPLHWHKEIEIIRVKKGELEIYLNNTKYLVGGGGTVIVNSKYLHRADPKECEYDCLVFDPSMLKKSSIESISKYILPIIDGSAVVRPVYTTADTVISDTVTELFTVCTERRECYELAMYSLLFRLFSKLYENNEIVMVPGDEKKDKKYNELAAMTDWIEAHYAEPVNLAKLAEISGLSEKYICKVFKKFTAYTPVEYINRLRIESACNEMVYGGMSVTEAALENGFNDPSYFSKLFKKIKGIAPKDYKRQMSEKSRTL